MKIILLTGLILNNYLECGIGKTTMANRFMKILAKHNKKAEIFSFADPLKYLVADMYSMSVNEVDKYKNDHTLKFRSSVIQYYFWEQKMLYVSENDLSNEWMTMRDILITVGTKIIRKKLDEDWFVERLIDRIEYSYIHNNIDVAIIDDCRFENEHDIIIETFGKENVYRFGLFKEWWKEVDDPEKTAEEMLQPILNKL